MMINRTNLEVIAPSIEEAIEQGLAELGLFQDEVEVEILDEGNKGLFGLGSRQARILLTVKDAPVSPSDELPIQQETDSLPAETEISELAEIADTEDAETEHVLQVAHDTVADLLEKMKVNALVTASFVENDEFHGQKPVLVDIHGDDLSILIGRKAETLNALQYITSLIVGKELGRAIPLSIDVEGYRNRRQKQLQQLAHRIAEQVTQTKRSQSLEPMPSNERRIIHIELRDDPHVYTESAGEGDYRKVVIYPK